MTREEAIAMIENDKRIHHDFLSGKYRQALTMAINTLKERPSGKWIVNREDSRGVCCCNNCFEQFVHVPMVGGKVPWNYCPNCGADMRGESDE